AEPRVKVWDVTGKLLHEITPPGLTPQTRGLRVFFSPDGSRLVVVRPPEATAARTPGDLTVWGAATGRPLPSPGGLEVRDGPSGNGSGPGFSPDGKQIANAEGNVLRTWDVETGRPVLTLRGHVHPIAARGFTADGRRLWSVEFDGLLKE